MGIYGYIDRDPSAILQYSREVKKYYDDMNSLITAARTVVGGFMDELDDKSREAGERFLEQASVIYRQLESYRDLSKQLERKANDLLDLQNSTRF